MKPHYLESDLLETYYMRPGESMPIMMHLAGCTECAARYERLDQKMQSLRSCAHDEKPDTFWIRQRMSILRRIEGGRQRVSFARVASIAAAAVLVLLIGALMTWNRNQVPSGHGRVAPVVTATTATTAGPVAVEEALNRLEPGDPWQSDELEDYSSMVDWESWMENGGQS